MTALRFCFLTTFYPPYNFGGDGIGVQRLARALAARGHAVTVVHDADAFTLLAGRPPAEAVAVPDGIEVVRLATRFPLLSSLLTHQTGRPVVNGRRLRRLFAARRFDVVNFNNISLIGGPGLLAYGGNALKLYFAHEHWLVCPTHVLWRHRREPCPARQCLRCQFRYRRPPQWWRLGSLLDRHLPCVDAFIAMSEFSRAKHREFGFPRDMEVIPYFLPDQPAPADSQARPRPHARPYFLFVGRLERIKGLGEVVPLFSQYRDADLVVVGDGEQAAELRQLAAGNPCVRFVGPLPGDELPAYYEHAIALLVPSLCYETFGIVLIEALSHRTPVIARRLGPFPEIVQQAGGELFDTPGELLAAMERLQRDPALRLALGEAGYRAYRERWSEAVVVARYLQLVERLLAPRVARAL